MAGAAAVIAAAVATVAAFSPARRILRKARSFVGQKEVQQNQGFSDPAFLAKMKEAQWYVGAQWCAFFVRMVFMQVCRRGSKGYDFWHKSIHPSTQQTWANLQAPSKYHEISSKAIPRSIVVYQGTSDPSAGHIEFVDKVYRDGSYSVISANDSIPGTADQGVASKKRAATGISSKYKILGFIKIKRL